MPTRPSQVHPQQQAEWGEYRRRVGRRIRELRVSRGMTQESLALSSGVTRNMMIDVESGRRGLLFERLFDLAKALGVPASQLLADEDNPQA